MAYNNINVLRESLIGPERLQRYEKDEKRAMDPTDESGYQVELFVYDLTRGLARTLSPALLGKQIEGVWHTGVVAYGREYFFGAAGIESCKPGGTILGEPDRIENLGESQVPYQLFLEYIFGLGESSYRPGAYDLLKHNCNNFSDEIAQLLCGRGVPKTILQLPDEILNTPLGVTLNDALQKIALKHADSRSINFGPLNNNISNTAIKELRRRPSYEDQEFDELNDAIDQIRHNSIILEEKRNSLNDKLSKKERKEKRKEKRERKEKRRKEKSEGGTKAPISPTNAHTATDDTDIDRQESYRQDQSEQEDVVQNGHRSSPEQIERIQIHELNTVVEEGTSLSIVENTSVPLDNSCGKQSPTPVSSTSSVTNNINTSDTDCRDINETTTQINMDETAPQAMDNPPAEASSEAISSPDPEIEPLPAVEREPPILFKENLDARRDFDELVGCCMHMLSNEEQHHMEELRSYVVEDDGAWALGENFGDIFARVFHDPNIPEQARYHLIRILAVAALKDDVILLLHQDRKDHTIMNFANKIEHLSPNIQEAIALFFCNMFEHLSPSEWLLYISEWTPTESTQQISNIRVTTKVAVNALLHSDAKVQDYGTALMYNLGTKEVKTVVFDDVAPELAMAILQYFSNRPKEEPLWRTITALCRFCYASSEVPSLIKMIGPEPNSFKGTSERIDTVIEEINAKLSRVRTY